MDNSGNNINNNISDLNDVNNINSSNTNINSNNNIDGNNANVTSTISNDDFSNVNNNNNKVDIKKILVIVGSLVILFIVFKFVSGCSIFGGRKNNTGSSEYKASDVDMTCVYSTENDTGKLTIYSDFLFNYKSKEGIVYQALKYNKTIFDYKETLTDERYQKFIDSFGSTKCAVEKCTDSHLELGLTDEGFDTVVDRKGNTVERTSYEIYGTGHNASSSDIKKVKKSYEDAGYTCK